MKNYWWVAVALALLCGCSGAQSATQEMERWVLLRVIGVDVSLSQMAGTTVTAVSGAQEGVAAVTLQGDGTTVAVASAEMRKAGAGLVSATHVGQIVLGESAAQRSVAETLEYIVRARELGLNANIWVAQGVRSEEIIQGSDDIVAQLERLAYGSGTGDVPLTTSVEELVAALAEHGGGFVPTVAWDGTQLTAGRYAIFSQDALVGYGDDRASFGIDLLCGTGVEKTVESSEPSMATMALSLQEIGRDVTPVFEDGQLVAVAVHCQMSASVAEKQGEVDMEWHRVAAEASCCDGILAALTLGQELETDYLNIQGMLALAAPWQKGAIAQQWEEQYQTLEWRVTTTVVYD